MALAHLLGADLAEMVDLAATPARELERRLAAAEERLRRLSNRSGPTEAGDRLEILETERQVAFLKNLLAARKKQEAGTRLPPRVVPLYDLKSVPVIGSIRAGKPRLAVEEALGYTAVPPDLEVDYALTVQGDSMIGAGIAPGDVVWVRQTDTARPGDTVVALLAGEEVTVKHLVQENGRYLLRANNPERSYPDLPLGPEDRIIGVVQRIVKRPGPPPKKPRADR
jgi:repressor LexA